MSSELNSSITESQHTQACLVVKQGSQIGMVFPIANEITVVGREPTCNVILHDLEVSRRHFQIVLKDKQFIIQDLGSTNKTFVNQTELIESRPMNYGDTISLGQTILMFDMQKGKAKATPKPPATPQSKLDIIKKITIGKHQVGILIGIGILFMLGSCGFTTIVLFGLYFFS
ncbi:MAG: hypothetical protein B6242_05710 [Anaerolineaceae bacterium 4572_78]|nr:MAG: hypothetical protein B6242_05710 [Anaerolineaceae bacterium 4572_78]